MKATFFGYVDIVSALLQAGVNKDSFLGEESYKQTILMIGIIFYFYFNLLSNFKS